MNFQLACELRDWKYSWHQMLPAFIFSVLQRQENCQRGKQLDYVQYPSYTEGWRQEGKTLTQTVLFACPAGNHFLKKSFLFRSFSSMKKSVAFSAYCRVNVQYSAWGTEADVQIPIIIHGSGMPSSLH